MGDYKKIFRSKNRTKHNGGPRAQNTRQIELVPVAESKIEKAKEEEKGNRYGSWEKRKKVIDKLMKKDGWDMFYKGGKRRRKTKRKTNKRKKTRRRR